MMHHCHFSILCSFIFQDYNDHTSELSNKLVAIMDIMFDSHLPKVRVLFTDISAKVNVNNQIPLNKVL